MVGKNLIHAGSELYPLRAVSYSLKNLSLECVQFSLRTCVMGATHMVSVMSRFKCTCAVYQWD